MNVRLRFLLLVTLSLGLSVAAIAVVAITRERQASLFSLEQQGYALADMMAMTFLAQHLRGEEDLIREIASEVMEGNSLDPEMAPLYVVVLSTDGKILFSKGTEILAPDVNKVLSNNALATSDIHLTDIVPISTGQRALDLKARMVIREMGGGIRRYGSVRLGLSLSALDEQAAATYRTIAVFGLAALLFGLAATYLTTRRLLSSLAYLADRVNAIARGDLSQRTILGGCDELAGLEQSVNRLAEDLQKRDLMKQYISSTAWDEIEKRVPSSGGMLTIPDPEDGGLRKVTVLFMDIRNFTALAESSRSREIVELLNDIFGMMVEIIEAYGGVLDKFIGDGLLTVFYPEDVDDDAIRAVYCAIEMQLRLEHFNQRRAFYGRDAVKAGIGINSGTVIAGTIGARTRKDFTVIGDPVNVAARLEKRSKEGRFTNIVISHETYTGVDGLVTVEALEGSEIRGRTKPVPVYEIISVKDVDQILRMLMSSDEKTRDHALKAVEVQQDDSAFPVLVDLLARGDEDLVLRSIVVLGRMGRQDDRIGPVLQDIVHSTKNKRILATAIKALAHQRADIDTAILKDCLSDKDARVRANTIEALDLLGGHEYLDWIEPLIYDDNGRVRGNAAVALWKRGKFEVGSILERLSYSPKADERSCAVFAAGELFRLAARSLNPGQDDARESLSTEEVLETELAYYKKLLGIIARLILDENEAVGKQAVNAAAKARDPGLAEALIKKLKNADDKTREDVLKALLKLGLPSPVIQILHAAICDRSKVFEDEGN